MQPKFNRVEEAVIVMQSMRLKFPITAALIRPSQRFWKELGRRAAGVSRH